MEKLAIKEIREIPYSLVEKYATLCFPDAKTNIELYGMTDEEHEETMEQMVIIFYNILYDVLTEKSTPNDTRDLIARTIGEK